MDASYQKQALEWWDDLPIQNLKDMSDSWVGYVNKYYPQKTDIYHLTNDEILHIWLGERKNTFIEKIMKNVFK
jgi:hypothetical protein